MGSAKLTKTADLDKHKYTGYGIELDFCSEFSFTDESLGKNVFFFSWYRVVESYDEEADT